MSNDPDNLVLTFLREMRGEMKDMHGEMATKADLAATKAEITDLRSELRSEMRDVASDLLVTRKELSEQIVGLRRAMIDYHTTIVGHASLTTDLEARLRRVEQHLNLSWSGH